MCESCAAWQALSSIKLNFALTEAHSKLTNTMVSEGPCPSDSLRHATLRRKVLRKRKAELGRSGVDGNGMDGGTLAENSKIKC